MKHKLIYMEPTHNPCPNYAHQPFWLLTLSSLPGQPFSSRKTRFVPLHGNDKAEDFSHQAQKFALS